MGLLGLVFLCLFLQPKHDDPAGSLMERSKRTFCFFLWDEEDDVKQLHIIHMFLFGYLDPIYIPHILISFSLVFNDSAYFIQMISFIFPCPFLVKISGFNEDFFSFNLGCQMSI